MTNQAQVRGGLGPFFALFLVFLALKLTGVIAWSWWWITAPLWAPTAIALGLAIAWLWVVTRIARNR